MSGTFIPQHSGPKIESALRVDPPNVGGEREVLLGFLEYQRATFELKWAGLEPRQLAEQAVPPSALSLQGLARHLAGCERWWFALQFAGLDLPMLYYTDEDPDQDFEFADADPATDLAVWRAECDRSRAIVDAAASLDQTGTVRRTGEPICLRALLVKMIAEYARHLGHADLLRERADGAVGL